MYCPLGEASVVAKDPKHTPQKFFKMTTVRPSDFLRVRLPPPRFTVSNPLRSHGSYTKISSDQVLACADFSVPTHWSIAPDLADRLIDAVSLDLDILLPQHPNLTPGLITVIEDLVRQELWRDTARRSL